jgi:5-(carboxyamino)imidazole ribonucleotide mutase
VADVSDPSVPQTTKPVVGVIMGSKSDWETMRPAAEMLDKLQIPYEARVISAHRTPDVLWDYAGSAEERGLKVIIAGAGGAAHLAGVTAARTLLPVLGVPIESRALHGMDSLLSIVQMPAGIPVGTLAIGPSGATNAALLAAAFLANSDPALRERLRAFREQQSRAVREARLESHPPAEKR